MTRSMVALFAYGTLRPGQPNFPLIADHVAGAEPARLVDHVLYGQGLPFPYVAPGPGTVIGDLLWFHHFSERNARHSLALELFHADALLRRDLPHPRPGHLGVHPPGRECVHCDFAGCEFEGQRAHESDQSGF